MSVVSTLMIRDRSTAALNKISNAYKKTERAAKAVDKATKDVDPGKNFNSGAGFINRAQQRLKAFVEKQKEAGKDAEKVKKAWGGVGGLIKTALAAFGVKQAVNLTLGGGLDMDAMEREFQARLGSDAVGSALFDKLRKQAQTSAFSLQDLAKNTSSFLSVTTDPKQIDGLNKIAEQLAVFDKTGQGLEGAGFSLKEALSGDIVSLAERFNMSKNAIRDLGIDKLGKSGDVDGFIKQFNELLDQMHMGSKEYEMMLESPKTQLNMFLSNLKTGFATASQEAITALTPLIMRLNEWFSSPAGQQFFLNIGQAVSWVVQGVLWLTDMLGQFAGFVAGNWDVIQPVLLGITAGFLLWKMATLAVSAALAVQTAASVLASGATFTQTAAQHGLNAALLASPFTLVVLAIVAIVAAIAYWVNAVGGLKIAWLIVCDAILTAWEAVKIGFMTGVFWVMDLWNKLQLAFMTAGVNIQNFMGDMKAGVLTILQNMVNGAIGIINDFINTLNKIPGVSIDLIDQVTFGTTAQLENEAAKQARGQELADYQADIENQIKERDKALDKMRTEAEQSAAERKVELAEAKAAKAEETGKEASGFDTNAWDQYEGAANVGNVEKVGEVGKVKGDVNIADEDIKFLRDVAEMRFVQNFVTLTPTVSMSANISEKVDVDEVVGKIEKKLEEEFAAEAEGVYA